MTIQNPPIFIQAGSHPAEDVRRWIGASVNDTEGVVLAGDLEVTEKSGTPDMSVDVAAGRAFIAGTEATYQGHYFAENRGSSNVAVAASDPTNPRIDLVVVRVRDSAYSGGTDTVSIEVVTGTPAASPATPSTPDNSLLLATVDVAALASAIVDADVTDGRVRAGTQPRSGPEMVTFTSSGSFVKADYPWARSIKVRAVGGGGGGGGCGSTGSGEAAVGGGGGVAAFAERYMTVDELGASETITIGASGAKGVGNANGSVGGTTVAFGMTVPGGDGGRGGGAVTATYSVVLGGGWSASPTGTFDYGYSGGGGMFGVGQGERNLGGSGGASMFGGGGNSGNASTSVGGNGGNGGKGAGGGGGANRPNQGTARNGGNGGTGIVVVELFA